MQALLSNSVAWLQIMPQPTAAQPLALQLHTASDFRSLWGFDPPAYSDFLALVGKPEAGVPGVGISHAAAKRAVRKHGGIGAMAAAAAAGTLAPEFLAPQPGRQRQGAPTAAAGAEAGPSSVPQALQHAQANLAVVAPRLLSAALLPEAPIRRYLSSSPQLQQPPPSEQRGRSHLALLYPPTAMHMAASRPWVAQLSAALHDGGIAHVIDHVTQEGLHVDVWLPQHQACVAVLGPTDLQLPQQLLAELASGDNGGGATAAAGQAGQPHAGRQRIAQLLRGRYGAVRSGGGDLAQLPREVKALLTAAAAHRLAQLKRWASALPAAATGPAAAPAAAAPGRHGRVLMAPFFEFDDGGLLLGPSEATAGGAVADGCRTTAAGGGCGSNGFLHLLLAQLATAVHLPAAGGLKSPPP